MSTKMKKLLLILLTVLASKWFAPIVFLTSTVAAMKIACVLQQCEREISPGDPSPPMFRVMVRLPTDGDRIKSVLLADLTQFIEKNPDSTLLLPLEKTVTNGGSWEYSAVTEKAGVQIIEAHTTDGARIDVRYRAFQHSVQPLSLKVVSQGILFVSIPIAGVLTSLFGVLARGVRRKFRNPGG